MRQLGAGLVSFRTALKQAGLWDRVLVMTYSEFGRRVAETEWDLLDILDGGW